LTSSPPPVLLPSFDIPPLAGDEVSRERRIYEFSFPLAGEGTEVDWAQLGKLSLSSGERINQAKCKKS